MLTDLDRQHLRRVCELARSVRRPPKKLGLRVEPVWAALLAEGSTEVGAAAYTPGDAQDAVAPLLGKTGETLYLSLEPKASFDRLPPVTESIRRLGVKRVVLGTLDPSHRYRGEGQLTLERTGVEVVVADGEEARFAQEILDDYTKWLRGVAVLRARAKLVPQGEGFVLEMAASVEGQAVDAVLCSAGKAVDPGNAWLVVLDEEGFERPSPRKILYQSQEASLIPGTRRLAFREGKPDLGALLRDLATLGIQSVELCGDAALLRHALRARLVDSVRAEIPAGENGAEVVAKVAQVRLQEEDVGLRFLGAHLLDRSNRYLEAQAELC